MRSSTAAHLAVSRETPSVPAKRVEINPMRRKGGIACSLIDQMYPRIDYSKMKCMLQSFYTTQLSILYGPELAAQVVIKLDRLVAHYRGRIPTPKDATISE